MRSIWLGAVWAFAGGCSSYSDAASSAAARDAGTAPVPSPTGATCDATKEPKDAPGCVADSLGIFVDATSGNNTAAGNRAAPVKSITTALGLLAGRTRLFLCVGDYSERVTLPPGVSIYGGFACGTWSYAGAPARIVPTERGVAITIVAPAGPSSAGSELADLEIEAANATDPGESSVGVLVANTALTIRRTKISASPGITGNPGTDATAATVNAPAGNAGGAPTNPGFANANPTCPTSIGGVGGLFGGGANDGAPGKVALAAPYPTTATGEGGLAVSNSCAGGSKGKDGSIGPAGVGGLVTSNLGTLDPKAGWTPAGGGDGQPGTDGQGGGGGAVRATLSGAIGGAGGAGGCGGPGGGHGQGGGGSIAIAAIAAPLTLVGTTLIAKNAGNGGNGGKGIDGQNGGSGGDVDGVASTAKGCAGGAGGLGGSSGGGAGGNGGVSVGVVYTGMAPSLDATSVVTFGTSGTAGVGGVGGGTVNFVGPVLSAGGPGANGIVGVAQATLALSK